MNKGTHTFSYILPFFQVLLLLLLLIFTGRGNVHDIVDGYHQPHTAAV